MEINNEKVVNSSINVSKISNYEQDVFISRAMADKLTFVDDLAKELKN